jgi:hypothetical protein
VQRSSIKLKDQITNSRSKKMHVHDSGPGLFGKNPFVSIPRGL